MKPATLQRASDQGRLYLRRSVGGPISSGTRLRLLSEQGSKITVAPFIPQNSDQTFEVTAQDIVIRRVHVWAK